jgi:predicted nucleic acid-binding protein
VTPTGGLLLVDTGVALHLARGDSIGARIDDQFGLRRSATRPLLSIVSQGELLAMASRRKWGESRRASLKALLDEFVIVPIANQDLVVEWAELRVLCQDRGTPMDDSDLWIAATASVARAELLTMDSDFERLPPGRPERHLLSAAGDLA